ncbi:hypothetical protein J2Z32_000394 [Paenibacillus turicensis]|uniref:Uncharacterized protein n=1 Tax=Paenibacillus turicensis TaxID=160487 RepID=A0ABS4FMH4_9BACL|nr:hypothetical protein [Paenibacillus turicensis]MBP1903782.1 hypothetical protein [Paenibacillus turicensis]
MRKNNIYGEILYIGLVAEKGRVFNEIWKYNYRKTLKLHVSMWQKILMRMCDTAYNNEDEQLLREFFELCKKRKDIGKYYNTLIESFSEIEQIITTCTENVDNTHEETVIISLMNDLFLELTELLKPKLIVDRKKIHLVIRVLHNLPRFFLQNPQTYIYGLKNVASSFYDVIEYSFGNMDQDMKDRYFKYKIT